jgi:hypothetical protein
LTDIRENGHLDNNADSSRYVEAEGHELFMTEVKALMRTWRRFYDGISNVLKATPVEYYINAWKGGVGVGVDGKKQEGLVSVGTKRRHSIAEVRFSENVIVIDESSLPAADLVVQRRRIEPIRVVEEKTKEAKDTVAESFVNSVNNTFTKLKINN